MKRLLRIPDGVVIADEEEIVLFLKAVRNSKKNVRNLLKDVLLSVDMLEDYTLRISAYLDLVGVTVNGLDFSKRILETIDLSINLNAPEEDAIERIYKLKLPHNEGIIIQVLAENTEDIKKVVIKKLQELRDS